MAPNDQANQLRRLVQDVSRTAAASPPAPALVLLLSGKQGVGTTTLAINLAVALVHQGRRTVLLDADAEGGNLALCCGVDTPHTLADVIADRQPLGGILQPGPAGLLVGPGAWGLDLQAEGSPGIGYGWIKQLRTLGDQADVVLLDGGAGVSHTAQRLLQAVDLALVVATPDMAAIMNTYALLKVVTEGNPRLRVQCLVNHAADMETARQVLERIVRASIRFLGMRPQLAGHVPNEAGLQAARYGEPPLVLAQPGCEAVGQIRRLADQISSEIIDRRPPVVLQTRLSTEHPLGVQEAVPQRSPFAEEVS